MLLSMLLQVYEKFDVACNFPVDFISGTTHDAAFAVGVTATFPIGSE